jgi:ABC-type multidrug transport system ATPase subunit
MAMTPVLAAGVGVRHARGWALRSASFRMSATMTGAGGLGIVVSRPGAATAVVDLLSGHARPAYGELRVLGEDLTTAAGRAAIRDHIGIARRNTGPAACRRTAPQGAFRVRGLVEHAARRAGIPAQARHLLAAAILDRLSLTPWAEVPVRSAPDVVARRARLAAAAVHEPALLLTEGLLDDLSARDAAELAECIRDLGREMAIIATGSDARALALICDEILTLRDGILISDLADARPPRPLP